MLIQQVDVNNSNRLVDSAGNPSPKLDLKGKGKALLFRDGKVIKGTWQMKNGRPYYRTASGDDFVFARGSDLGRARSVQEGPGEGFDLLQLRLPYD